MKNAISYIRFSSTTQAKGNSLDRQRSQANQICEEMGWNLLDIQFHDLGVSAFKGKNSDKGELSKFIRAVQDGEIKPGTILIVENLDRISRESVPDAFSNFISILNLGIDIFTTFDRQLYTRERISTDTSAIFTSIIYMVRANEESATKSKRVKAAVNRKKAKGEKYASRFPHWLELNDNEFSIIEENAKVIRLIFELYLNGTGSTTIARYLNEHHPKIKRKSDGSDIWTSGIVLMYLRDHSVRGVLVPTIKNEPWIPDYYPRIISDEDFFRANRNNPKNTYCCSDSARKIFYVSCECGKPLKIAGKARKKQSGDGYIGEYLRCTGSHSGTCEAKSLHYRDFEDYFLNVVTATPVNFEMTVQQDESVFDEQLKLVNKQIENLSSAIALLNDPNQIPILVNRIAELQNQANDLQHKIKSEVKVSSIPKRVERLLIAHDELLKNPSNDSSRLKLRAALGEIVEYVKISKLPEKFNDVDGRRMIIKLIGADETMHFLPTERVRGYKTK